MLDIISQYNFWDGQITPTGFLRPIYIDTIQKYYGSDLVKVLLGQRRVGKSYIMRMLISRLLKEHHVAAKNILYLNMDLQPMSFIQDSVDLMHAITAYQEALKPEGRIYIFIDEVQEIKDWEKVVNSLSQDYAQQYEVFITGSNANLLSQELGTYLSGRFVSFEIFPFSYGEYLDFHQLTRNKQTLLDYLYLGGLPENYRLNDDEMRENYTRSLRDSILLRDIVKRYQVRDANLLGNLANFTEDSIGSLFSIHSIVKYLNSHRHKTNVETIGNYLNYLCAAYYIHSCERYDIKGR
ncbi:MAG: ATP-binding protein, partial [Gammaproteobacteria bacterium]